MTLVCDAANAKHVMDKDVSTEIQNMIAEDADLGDDQAGWHVIVGKSFAASVTYNTKHVIFFDLLAVSKSFMLFKTQ
jgi:hypothetical protein